MQYVTVWVTRESLHARTNDNVHYFLVEQCCQLTWYCRDIRTIWISLCCTCNPWCIQCMSKLWINEGKNTVNTSNTLGGSKAQHHSIIYTVVSVKHKDCFSYLCVSGLQQHNTIQRNDMHSCNWTKVYLRLLCQLKNLYNFLNTVVPLLIQCRPPHQLLPLISNYVCCLLHYILPLINNYLNNTPSKSEEINDQLVHVIC